MPITIAAAHFSDIDAIAAIHVRSWQEAYAGLMPAEYLANLSLENRIQQWNQTLSEGKSTVLLAKLAGETVAWICFGPTRDSDAPANCAEIYAIYSLAAHHGNGLGRALWLACKAQLQAQAYTRVTLWVIADNARARRFYAAAGFSLEENSNTEFSLAGARLWEVRYGLDLSLR